MCVCVCVCGPLPFGKASRGRDGKQAGSQTLEMRPGKEKLTKKKKDTYSSAGSARLGLALEGGSALGASGVVHGRVSENSKERLLLLGCWVGLTGVLDRHAM